MKPKTKNKENPMKVKCAKFYRALVNIVVPRHHRIGEEHVTVSAMEKHLVDDAKHVFQNTDWKGIHVSKGRDRSGFKLGI